MYARVSEKVGNRIYISFSFSSGILGKVEPLVYYIVLVIEIFRKTDITLL